MANVFIERGVKTLAAVADGDDVFILGGNALIDTAIDQSALAEGLHSFKVAREFSGQGGSVGAPVKFDLDAGTAGTREFKYAASGGSFYYHPGGDEALCSNLQIAAGGATFYLVGGGTVTKAGASSGNLQIASPVTVTALYVDGASVVMYDDSSTDPTTVVVTAGSLDMRRGGTTIDIRGGSCNLQAGANAITTLSLDDGAITLRESGTIGTFNYYGGTINTDSVARPIIISQLNYFGSAENVRNLLTHPLITVSASTPLTSI